MNLKRIAKQINRLEQKNIEIKISIEKELNIYKKLIKEQWRIEKVIETTNNLKKMMEDSLF